jgi:hypothetical protein
LAVTVAENDHPTVPNSTPLPPGPGGTSCSVVLGGEGDGVVLEQFRASGIDQLPWTGPVNTRVSLPEKLSEDGVN